jgi:hypothetical protein
MYCANVYTAMQITSILLVNELPCLHCYANNFY